MNQYRTLRELDGQQYIAVAEHEEILKGVGDLVQTMHKIKEAMGTLNQATAALTTAVGKKA